MPCVRPLCPRSEYLKKQEFDQAYEFLLASLRSNPSDPAVFAAVVDFVSGTAKNSDPKVEALSQDLYRRADLLVTYQPLDSLISARQQYLKLGEAFADVTVPNGLPASATLPPNDMFADIQKSIESRRTPRCL